MKAEETPCPACGAYALRIEMRLEAVERFSVAGTTLKVSARKHPYLVCDGCGVTARAKDE